MAKKSEILVLNTLRSSLKEEICINGLTAEETHGYLAQDRSRRKSKNS